MGAVTCRPVVVVLAGANSWSPVDIAFHCACGVDRREVIVHHGDLAHDIDRYVRAIKKQHQRGLWPLPVDTNPQYEYPAEEVA
jgi:hypothetical protein